MQFMIDRDDRARENKKLGKKGDTSWVEEELEKRRQEQADYDKLTPINGGPWGAGDNPSGMYELCGRSLQGTRALTIAMITHKGASADSGELESLVPQWCFELISRPLYRLGSKRG